MPEPLTKRCYSEKKVKILHCTIMLQCIICCSMVRPGTKSLAEFSSEMSGITTTYAQKNGNFAGGAEMAETPYQIPTEMRDFAEKSVEQARKAFESFMGAAHKAAGTVEGTAETVQLNAKDLTA